jgi:hypothetical protein
MTLLVEHMAAATLMVAFVSIIQHAAVVVNRPGMQTEFVIAILAQQLAIDRVPPVPPRTALNLAKNVAFKLVREE